MKNKHSIIFLDESGDLGWSFGAPYRKGGSSRYLTIAAAVVSHEKRHLPGRVIKGIYQKYHWDPKIEKKWSGMEGKERIEFSKRSKAVVLEYSNDISLHAITVYKPRVQEHIRRDPNKLYNYMVKKLLLSKMAEFDTIDFLPDPRCWKVGSGNSLNDYLQTVLWMERGATTKLKTRLTDSASEKGVQFADMLSGVVQQHFEDKKSSVFEILKEHIKVKPFLFAY